MATVDIEQLQNEVDQVKSDLDSLKSATDETIKQQKAKEFKESVKTTKEKINEKIEDLKALWEDTYKVEIEKLQDMLTNITSYVEEAQALKVEISEEESEEGSEKVVKVKKDDDDISWWDHVPGVGIGVGAGVTAGTIGNRIVKKATQGEKISETVNVAKTRKSMDRIVTMLNVRLKDTELLDCQKENIKKSITYFEEARDNSEAIEYVKIRKKLWDKLPIETLQKLEVTKDMSKQLKLIYDDEELIQQIALLKDEGKIKALLKARNITDIPDDAIKLFKFADKADEVGDIAKVLSMAKPIKTMAKGLRAVPYLDIAAAGVDIRVYINESKEADLVKKTNEIRGMNKQQQANFHLAMAGIDLAVGITMFALTCASCWPPGRIVLVVSVAAAAITYAATSIADAYYYEVVDFYLRNKEDYKSLYRMEIKEAILAATVRGDSSFGLSWSEEFAEAFNRSDSVDENKTVTLEDAYRTMIYLEEKKNYPTVASLNPKYPKDPETMPEGDTLTQYTTEKTELDKVMELRMEYIKKFLPHTTTSADATEYGKFTTAIRWSNGVGAIEQIVTDSKTYQKMKQDTEISWYTDIKKYQEAKLAKLKTTNEKRYTELEKIYQDDPMKAAEIYYNVLNFDFTVKDIESYKDTYQELEPKITFIKTYYESKVMSLPIEKQKSLGSISDISYVKVQDMLKNMDTEGIVIKPNVFTEDTIKTRIVNGLDLKRFDDSYAEYTSSIGQNVIYRIAKEIYGYEGKNDVVSMMVYFSAEKNESLGMYFDDGRYINIVNGGDNKITFKDIETKTADELMEEYIQHSADDNIDTPVENVDDELNTEFKARVRTIIEEEKSFQTGEKKEEVEKEIVEYIKTNATEWYIKLPYDLINDAKRAGLGNVEYFYYTYKDGGIAALAPKGYVDEKIDFGKDVTITKSYVENVRTEFSEEEQAYIDYVEDAYDRLMELRKVNGTLTQEDELDLPEEFERTIGDKYKERQNFKESLLWYSAEKASSELLQKYEIYRAYFENLYMGILIEVKSHSFSNDIDGYQYLMSALSQADSWFFDFENEKMTEGVLSEDDTKIFYATIKSTKVFGKTIIELVKSEDDEEKAKGYRAAKQVLKAMLESKTLELDEKGNITDIYSGEYTERWVGFLLNAETWIRGTITYSMDQAAGFKTMLAKNLQESRYLQASDIDVSKITTKTDTEVTIKELTKEQQETYDTSTSVLKEIEDTANNIVRQDQRGNIIYDPEAGTITSRNANVKVDVAKKSITGLDISFSSLDEMLHMANMINRIQGRYLKEHPDFKWLFDFWSRTGKLYVNDGYIFDTDVISSDMIADKFPSLTSETNQEAFKYYVNEL